jgi:hypothetical protein
VVGGERVVRAIGCKFSEIEIASEDCIGVVGVSR